MILLLNIQEHIYTLNGKQFKFSKKHILIISKINFNPLCWLYSIRWFFYFNTIKFIIKLLNKIANKIANKINDFISIFIDIYLVKKFNCNNNKNKLLLFYEIEEIKDEARLF